MNTAFASRPAPLDTTAILTRYRNARRRLLLIDYDGTLVAFRGRPEEASPPTEVLSALTHVVADSRNTVALISGRIRADLDRWFSSVPGLCLAAEHGAVFRRLPAPRWDQPTTGLAGDWKTSLRSLLGSFVSRTPGSFIEDKEYSLVWHYRLTDSGLGERHATRLLQELEPILRGTGLRAVQGHRIVEIKPAWAHKGRVVEQMVTAAGQPDFVLAIGDDSTDEDLFAALDDSAWTVHVGGGKSCARYALPSPVDVIDLLNRFAAA